MDSFAMVRVAAAQTRLRGPIVASEQADDFEQVETGVWLLARSDVRQTYEGAAYRTPIHRVLVDDRSRDQPARFRRQAPGGAYASENVMLRDTPEGYRYLKRSRSTGEGTVQAEPEIAGRANRVRTLAVGVILDPNISVPLPFAGLSYVDFNLFGTGTQLSAFFGGTYGQLAFSGPVAWRHALAACRAGFRHRVVVQRSRVRGRARDIRREHPAAAGAGVGLAAAIR